jgi:hypothetical protein
VASWGLPTLANVGPAGGGSSGGGSGGGSDGGGSSGSSAPTTPTSLSATGNNGSVTLTWAPNPANEGVTGYNVYRVGQPFVAPWTTTSATTFTNFDQVSNGTQYCYQLSATNSFGTSALTAPACATPRAPGPGGD